jgi:23S rRNA (uracil1939-C5)-methyltransferase
MSRQRRVVEATALDEHGAGVGRDGATTFHIANLLPGERAEVGIDHQSPHAARAWGHVVSRIGKASADRVAPACPQFGRCGGCTWQHLSYGAQLREKRDRVATALAGVPAVARGKVHVADVVPSRATLGYRNKGKYVAGLVEGRYVLGAYAPRSHAVVDTLGCRVVAPVIDEVATWARGAAEASDLVPYDEVRGAGELRYVVIRANRGGDVLAGLVVTSATPRRKLEQVANGLARHPALRGLVAVRNDRRDGAILPSGSPATVLVGSGTLPDHVAGVDVDVGIGEFLQVNPSQASAMYARVVELAAPTPKTRAIDLYAGVGGIAFALAAAGADVVAIELDRDAVASLRRAAARAGLERVRAEASDAALMASADADVVVVNPPRKGLAEAALAAVVAAKPPTIVYVSCGPESLSRDLIQLWRGGWNPTAIEPFDLMPGTGQVETVVHLSRTPS